MDVIQIVTFQQFLKDIKYPSSFLLISCKSAHTGQILSLPKLSLLNEATSTYTKALAQRNSGELFPIFLLLLYRFYFVEKWHNLFLGIKNNCTHRRLTTVALFYPTTEEVIRDVGTLTFAWNILIFCQIFQQWLKESIWSVLGYMALMTKGDSFITLSKGHTCSKSES